MMDEATAGALFLEERRLQVELKGIQDELHRIGEAIGMFGRLLSSPYLTAELVLTDTPDGTLRTAASGQSARDATNRRFDWQVVGDTEKILALLRRMFACHDRLGELAALLKDVR